MEEQMSPPGQQGPVSPARRRHATRTRVGPSAAIRSAAVFMVWWLWLGSPAGVLSARQPLAATADDIRVLMKRPAVEAALKHLSDHYDQMVEDLVALTEIPAPPFKEEARARNFAERLRGLGLKDVHIDKEGNVVGERPGAGAGPTLLLAAHLDTVFPAGTKTRVRKHGSSYAAPGIGDNTHGLAVMLALIRALEAVAVRTGGDIIFVGDVGEEGLGDLRGVRYLFEKSPLRQRVDLFVSMDGLGDSAITNGGVASRRYRVTYRGPGGPQLRGLRPGEPGLRHGCDRGPPQPPPSARTSKDDLQRGSLRRRHFGERPARVGVDGGGFALLSRPPSWPGWSGSFWPRLRKARR